MTVFSWGYWGWGNATIQLIEAADLVEKTRGYRPPIFVDIRLRRQGRAKGFVGDAFRNILGPSRYYWMQDLGNAHIASGRRGIKIKRPEAVEELLNLSLQAARDRRRVIYFCACEFPLRDGKRWCHRDSVSDLLLEAAKKRRRSLLIQEWPGGKPVKVEKPFKVDPRMLSGLLNGRMSIPFERKRLASFAGLPWGSILSLDSIPDGRTELVAIGPARFAASKDGEQWQLPVFWQAEAGKKASSLRRDVAAWRIQCGLHERSVR